MSFYISHFAKKLPREPEPQPLSVIGYVHDDISGDLEINKLVEKNERDKKIIELFNAQLLLPINHRSKALMKKFGIDVSKNGQIDAWPQSTAVKFHVNAYFPPDNTINDAARLVGTKSKILGLFTEQSTGNTYYFYFPLSMNGVTEDNVLKLDNFNTWIYRDTGEPVPDMGDEYNIYHALLDQLMNRNLNASNAYLATLGMYSPEKGATFTLRNRNIRVECVVRNAGNAALNKIKLQSKETPAAGYGDDELNQMIPPIGEETLSIEKKLDDVADQSNVYDVTTDDYDDIPPLEPRNGVTTTTPPPDVEINIPPLPPDEEFGDDVSTTTTTSPDEVIEETTEETKKKKKIGDNGGLVSLADVMKSDACKDEDPFPSLALRFPDYNIQIKRYDGSNYSRLSKLYYLINKIDKDKKLIEVYVQAYAHHKQIQNGKLKGVDVYKQYNREFISTGDKEKALENIPAKTNREVLEQRFTRFSGENVRHFAL